MHTCLRKRYAEATNPLRVYAFAMCTCLLKRSAEDTEWMLAEVTPSPGRPVTRCVPCFARPPPSGATAHAGSTALQRRSWGSPSAAAALCCSLRTLYERRCSAVLLSTYSLRAPLQRCAALSTSPKRISRRHFSLGTALSLSNSRKRISHMTTSAARLAIYAWTQLLAVLAESHTTRPPLSHSCTVRRWRRHPVQSATTASGGFILCTRCTRALCVLLCVLQSPRARTILFYEPHSPPLPLYLHR